MNPAIFTELRFATPAINTLANTLRQWFAAAVIGALIYGPSRAGKSSAIEYIIQRRVEIFGYDIPVIAIPWKGMALSEKDFHERFLNACGHSVPSERTANRRLESRLVEYLASAVALSGNSCLILFIDDAQEMRLDDLAFLANIYNLLKKRKIQLFTFLVGERTLPKLREKADAEGCERYVGRFMCADYIFPLLQSAEDIAFVLRQYDVSEDFEGSGVTIAQRLLPKAVANGFRFEKMAPMIWNGFRRAVRTTGRQAPRMTMQSFTILIAQLVQGLARRDAPDLKLTDDDISQAVQLIRYLRHR